MLALSCLYTPTRLAMNDVIPQMHASFGLRPCLCNPRLSAAGAVIAMEADVAAAAGMRLASRPSSTSSAGQPILASRWK